MIRILHTIDTTGPGGAETVFVNLVKGIDKKLFEPFAAIRGPGWVYDELHKNGINPIFINARGGFNLRYLFQLIMIIRKMDIDIIHSHLYGSNVYCSLAGLICKIPVISTFHGFVDASGSNLMMSLKKLIINIGSTKIVFVSNILRLKFIDNYKYSFEKSTTVYNGIDLSIFYENKNSDIRKTLGISSSQILIGAIGNIRPAKGYEYLLKAAKIVCDCNKECQFILVGSEDNTKKIYHKLVGLRDELGLNKVFSFLEFQNDIPKVLNNLDLFVLSSTSEGFSIITVEALACNLPVVVTRSGGPEEIISDYPNIRIAETQNEEDLASAILETIEHIKYNKYTAKNTKNIDKFSINTMISNYSEIYASCLENIGHHENRN